MFKRGSGISRSLHAPHGVNINALHNNPRMKRKMSWSDPKVRNAASEGVLTHRPVILKEGFLYKPGFLKITGRKRRWCVLRTYSQTEASIDIYTDDTKSRFKGTISLDKDLCPMLIVKNYDNKKKSPKNVYLSLKIGKRTYQFIADSFRELKEWSALFRQAIDNGLLFSGKITEPLNIEDGMVNIKFNSNCIAVICPIKENAIKTWRLNHITSFGQCGGILTFECCNTCSDPGTCRCSVNVIQEKSSTLLNLMEKAIRSNPNTGEIHYERSILGDIYHCDHDCGQPQRLLPAYSDPNIYRSASTSPQKEVVVPADLHEFEVPYSTLSSNDSGFPGTPLSQHDVQSVTSHTPSPTEATARHNHIPRQRAKISIPHSPINAHSPIHARSYSETAGLTEDDVFERRPRTDTDPSFSNRMSAGRLANFTDIKTNSPPMWTRLDNSVQYSTVQLNSPAPAPAPTRDQKPHKLKPVDENDGIYDTPEYWEVNDSGFLSPPGVPNSQRSSRSECSSRSEDLPPVPSSSRHKRARPEVREVVKLFNGSGETPRGRLRSHGDVLDFKKHPGSKYRGSVDNLSRTDGSVNYIEARNDLLSKLHEQEDLLTKFLARSRNERNDELGDVQENELNRKPYRCFGSDEVDCDLDSESHLYASPTPVRSGRSSTASDRGDRVLTKVASDTVRGYAYKIQIPLSDTVYDVPRRAAPAPDLSNLRSDAPPKPQRYITSIEP